MLGAGLLLLPLQNDLKRRRKRVSRGGNISFGSDRMHFTVSVVKNIFCKKKITYFCMTLHKKRRGAVMTGKDSKALSLSVARKSGKALIKLGN